MKTIEELDKEILLYKLEIQKRKKEMMKDIKVHITMITFLEGYKQCLIDINENEPFQFQQELNKLGD